MSAHGHQTMTAKSFQGCATHLEAGGLPRARAGPTASHASVPARLSPLPHWSNRSRSSVDQPPCPCASHAAHAFPKIVNLVLNLNEKTKFPMNGKVEFDFLPGCKSDLPMVTDRKDREKKERGAPTREIYSPPPDHDQSRDRSNNRNALLTQLTQPRARPVRGVAGGDEQVSARR